MSFFRSIIEWLYSRWRIRFRKRVKAAIKFSFIAHPRTFEDVYNKFQYIRLIPRKSRMAMLKRLWPLLTSVMESKLTTAKGDPIKGHFITIPYTPEIIFRDIKRFRQRVVEASILGRNMGSCTVGLGALIPPLIPDARWLEDQVDVKITTGFAFSILITLENIRHLTKLFDLNLKKSTTAIIGGSQITGRHVALKMADQVKRIILFDQPRQKDKLISLKNELDTRGVATEVDILEKPTGLKKADLIIVFTSARGARLQPEYISPGTIIIDDTQPSAISPDLVQTRDDILIVDGGIIHLPGFNPHFKLGLLRKGDMWGCLAETIILTWLHAHGQDIAQLNPKENLEGYLKILASSAETIGFCPAEPRSFGRYPVEEEKIAEIKSIRHQRFKLDRTSARPTP